jgi:Cu/Ag efflux protein CusF
MTTRWLTTLTLLGTLTACGEQANESPATTVDNTADVTEQNMEASHHQSVDGMAMDHSAHGDEAAAAMAHAASMDTMPSHRGGIGEAVGTVRDVDAEAGYITISHGEFSGDISMGAMTMGFETMGDVNLANVAADAEVAFRVKQGRDGSYRIMEICPSSDGTASCLTHQTDG